MKKINTSLFNKGVIFFLGGVKTETLVTDIFGLSTIKSSAGETSRAPRQEEGRIAPKALDTCFTTCAATFAGVST